MLTHPLARFSRFHVGCLSVVVFSLTVATASSDDTWDTLIADYKAHGLPMPSNAAQLSILQWKTGTSNGVPQYRQVLTFLEPEDRNAPARYWMGCRREALADSITVTPTEPTAASLAKTQRIERTLEREGFGTFPDVALAIQVAARGWNDLAAGLLARSRQGPQGPFSLERIRPVSHRAALATVAWNYWCEEFCTEQGDRASIVERLSQLQGRDNGLDSQAHQNVIEDMRQTLAPTDSPPESVESLIDSLIDLGADGGWRGRGLATLSLAGQYESYRKLEGMGLEAVPVLLEHTRDFRMTRCVESDDRGTWHIRIADVVRKLFNGLVSEEFAFDFLMREGRGKCVDRAHVLHWWTETQKVAAREYLLANALTADADGEVTAHAAMLHALGRGYPEDLVRLFAENVDRVEYPYALFDALGNSLAADKDKAELFLRATKSQNAGARISALGHLLKMKHPQAVPLLIDELRAIPKTPQEPYWESTAGRFAQLVCGTDDSRAWAALAENAKRVDIGQRLEMIQAVGRISGSQADHVIDFLAAFLDDEEVRVAKQIPDLSDFDDPKVAIEKIMSAPFSGPSAGFEFERLSVRDFAALQLASQVGVKADADSSWKAADWESLRVRVREALARRKK